MATAEEKAELYATMARELDNEGLHYYLTKYTSPETEGLLDVDPELTALWELYETVAGLIQERIETAGKSEIPPYLLAIAITEQLDPTEEFEEFLKEASTVPGIVRSHRERLQSFWDGFTDVERERVWGHLELLSEQARLLALGYGMGQGTAEAVVEIVSDGKAVWTPVFDEKEKVK